MQYYEKLDLVREPFSNAPDPDLFYRSKEHMECLQQMEIAVRLRRGLNVVIGDVGVGKTTLCRQLIRVLGFDEKIESYLLLDPYFKDPLDFLRHLNKIFGIPEERIENNYPTLKENLKSFLYERGVRQGRIVTLIVDEGQKITGECLEFLRELLNFETNESKLLQIVLFAQKEFAPMLRERPNLADRVNFRFDLEPFDFAETKRMIETRLGLSSKDTRAPELFTGAALLSIHRRSGGFPRKIVQLCHKSLLLMVSRERQKAGWFTVAAAARGLGRPPMTVRRALVWTGACVWVLLPILALTGNGPEGLRRLFGDAASAVAQRFASAPAPEVALPPSPEVRAKVTAEAPRETPVGMNQAAAPEAKRTERANPSETARLPEVSLPGLSGKTAQGPAPAALPESAPALASSEEIIEITVPSAASAGPSVPTKPAASAGSVASTKPLEPAAPMATAAQSEPAPAAPSSEDEQIASIAGLDAAEAAKAPVREGAAADNATARIQEAPPAALGSVPVKKGWTVSRRASRLYGSGGKRILAAISGTNPELASLNTVLPGQMVNFPAIVAKAPEAGTCLLRIGRTDALDMAFSYLDNAPAAWPPLALFAYYTPGQGLFFDVIVDKSFPDKVVAARELAALPADLAAKAVIVDSFAPDTVFFTDLGRPEPTRMAPKTDGKAVADNQKRKG